MKKLIIILAVFALSAVSFGAVTLEMNFDTDPHPSYQLTPGSVGYWGVANGAVQSIDTVTKASGAGSLKTAGGLSMYTDGGGGFSNAVDITEGRIEMDIALNWEGAWDGAVGGDFQTFAVLGGDYDHWNQEGIQLQIYNDAFGARLMAQYKPVGGSYQVFEGSTDPLAENCGLVGDWAIGEFHNVAFTWNATDLAFYLDGVLLNTAARGGGVQNFLEVDHLNLGGGWANIREFDGWIDNLAVRNDVPEPATICLLGLGGLALLKRRKA